MKTYNIAIIGCGGMGKTHAYSIASVPFYYPEAPFRAVLHTLVSRDPKNAVRYGFLKHTDNFYDVINDKDIDIVDICTPNTLHFEQAKAAILAGKHVFCEKPLAKNAAEARELARLAKTKGVICGLNFQNRFWAGIMRAKELIADGRIGDIITFRAAFLHSSSLDKNKPYAWRYSSFEEGGGVLIDLGSHLFDMINLVAGEIADIECMTKTLHTKRQDGENKVDITSDDAAFMVARLKNGAVGTIEATKLATGFSDSLKIEVHGTNGAIAFDTAYPNTLKFFEGNNKDGALGGESGWMLIDCMQKYPEPCAFQNKANNTGGTRAHIHCYFEFLRAVEGGTQFRPDFDDGAYVQEIIEKAKGRV